MSAEALLSRLDGVKQTGAGRWTARCPAHVDQRASLSLRELEDGKILVHCFALCGFDAIIAAANVDVADLFPPPSTMRTKFSPKIPKIPAMEILLAIAHEALVVSCAAVHIADGTPLNGQDHDRLILASRRIGAAVEVAHGRY